ncbi:sialidase family protein [Nocardiopsis xinjiangensis]|uniref:sialidase family protein n=1 Tax=Nocardiopsis xinjiangensis TaxID=124285 RepID=UPI000348D1E0|nr:sialidase family protein [Nocardiopsis xinjiangensis]
MRYDADARAGTPEARRLLFTNTAHETSRQNLTVRMSCDDGGSWPVSRTLESGAAGYSAVVSLGENEFGVLYERGNHEHITFARFSSAWLGGSC